MWLFKVPLVSLPVGQSSSFRRLCQKDVAYTCTIYSWNTQYQSSPVSGCTKDSVTSTTHQARPNEGFVKGLDKDSAAYKYLCERFSEISKAKLKEGILIGSEIHELMKDGEFFQGWHQLSLKYGSPLWKS